ncbi:MAG: hypothetical protein H6727_04475 [Myxococcales bacterium]|nr:hypothetical protein [Myxococcales bacterium]
MSCTPPPCAQDLDCDSPQVCQQGKCVSILQEPLQEPTSEPQAEPLPEASLELQHEPSPQEKHMETTPEDAGNLPEPQPEPTKPIDPPKTGPCQAGESFICYSGDPSHVQHLPCITGVQHCLATGVWSTCRGEVLPTQEVCDGIDNDCDGKTDEQLIGILCPKQEGPCQGARQICGGKRGWLLCDEATYLAYTSRYEPAEISCDGLDNDCDGYIDRISATETCPAGSQKGLCQKAYPHCSQGTRTCSPVYNTPSIEVCDDQLDNDCDGKTDEAADCPSFSAGEYINQTTLGPQGVFFSVPTASTDIWGRCERIDGSVVRQRFKIATIPQGQTLSKFSVFAQKTGFLAIWAYYTIQSGVGYLYSYTYQLYDATCQPQGNTGTIPIKSADLFDLLEIKSSSSGYLALLLRRSLSEDRRWFARYHVPTQSLNGPTLVLDEQRTFCKSNQFATVHLGISDDGSGIFTCHGQYPTPIYFQRWDTQGTLQGTQPSPISSSTQAYPGEHVLLVNGKGDFLVGWNSNDQARATVFSAQGTLQKSLSFGNIQYRQYLKYAHPMLAGDDFAFFDNQTYYRISPQGQIKALSRSFFDSYTHSLQFNDQGESFGLLQDTQTKVTQLAKLSIHLPQGRLLCQGKPCVCVPNETRDCNEGGELRPAPCHGGKQRCQPDGLSWGPCEGQVLPIAELCQNQEDDDCDGKIDESCTELNAIKPPPAAYQRTFAVSAEGHLTFVGWNGNAIFGACYRPDRTVLRGAFIVRDLGNNTQESPKALSVRVAAKSRSFIVTWAQQRNGSKELWGRLYDQDCRPRTQAFRWAGALEPGFSIWERAYDIDIDRDGYFALLYRNHQDLTMRLWLFDPAGQALQSDVVVDKDGSVCSGAVLEASKVMRIALHPTQRYGAILCQGKDAPYRIDFAYSSTFSLSNPQKVPNASQQTLSMLGTLFAIHEKGQQLIAKLESNKLHGYWYDSQGNLIAERILANVKSGYSYQSNTRLLQKTASDFIFPATTSLGKVVWFRLNAQGGDIRHAVAPSSTVTPTLQMAEELDYIGSFVQSQLIIRNKQLTWQTGSP